MLELFRNNVVVTSLLLLPYVIVLRLHSLIFPVSYYFSDTSNSFLTTLVFGEFTNPVYQAVLAIVLVFFQALLINYIFTYHKYSKDATLFAGLFYVLFVSMNPATNTFNPVLIANTFVLLALHNLLKSYKTTSAAPLIFNSGFFLCLAGLFYTPYTILFLFGILSLLVLRSFRIREKLQYLAGLITPVYLIVAIFYWYDTNLSTLQIFKGLFFVLPSPEYPILFFRLIPAFILILFIPFVLFQYNRFTGRKNIQVQKKTDILYWLMLFGLISFLLFQTQGHYHLLTICIPVCILVAGYVSGTKRKVAAELIHLFILIFAGLSQYG